MYGFQKINLIWPFLLLLTLASLLGINQYHFGQWNHYATIPWLMDLINPALFPHDILVAERVNSPSFFLPLLRLLLPLAGGSVTGLFIAVYLLALFFTFFGFHRIGMALHGDQRAAVLGTIVLAFTFPVIAGVEIWDSLLMERSLALPILLLSIAMAIARRYTLMVLLQGLSFWIHPLSSVHVVALTALAVLGRDGWRWSYLKGILAYVLLALPILYQKYSHSTGDHFFTFSNIWWEVMQVRNAHHSFPSDFNTVQLIKLGLTLAAYFVLVFTQIKSTDLRRFLLGFGFAVLALLSLGIVFSELYPIRIAIQLQFFRVAPFFIMIFVLLWAGLIIRRANPVTVTTGLLILALHFNTDFTKTAAAWATILLSVYFLRQWGWNRSSFAIITGFYCLAAIAGLWARGGFEPGYPQDKKNWLAAAEWLKENSSADALIIVPPAEPGFRVLTKRTVYGVWYDGTKAFFSENFARKWQKRMQTLGYRHSDSLRQTFMKLPAPRFDSIARQEVPNHSEIYLVHYRQNPLSAEPVYRNQEWEIFQLHP